jgi:hypothetical protein
MSAEGAPGDLRAAATAEIRAKLAPFERQPDADGRGDLGRQCACVTGSRVHPDLMR